MVPHEILVARNHYTSRSEEVELIYVRAIYVGGSEERKKKSGTTRTHVLAIHEPNDVLVILTT
jgi:predicted rRNA methylase YqxC with S4 and FtsJ domains